eukprot:scaffold451_cov184-Amphora_coffeaeformis.AAC.1
MISNQEEKDQLDPPPQQHNEDKEEANNRAETQNPHQQHNENEQQAGVETPRGLSTAPSILSISSHPSTSSFASPPTVMNPTSASYASSSYYHPHGIPMTASHHGSRNNFNRHNHAMCTSMKTFPEKLHQILDYAVQHGLDDVIGFFSHGRAFKVHKPRRFVLEVMPRFFKQTKLTSFQRQLNLYGFKRISTGSDNGGYYHPLFLQGQSHLAEQIKRQAQSKARGGSSIHNNNPSSDMRKVTPVTQPHPSTLLPPSAYGGSRPPPHSYYPYPHPSYYGMHPPPNGSYHPPYPYPYMYGSGWPAAYGAPPPATFTPYATASSSSAPPQQQPHVMPQVSPVVSNDVDSPQPSFTPIKLSSLEEPLSWTPGGLCIDD